MHSATQTLAHGAHRAQIAKTKPRWQPYSSTPSTSIHHLRSPLASHTSTPVSAYSSPQPNPAHPDFHRIRHGQTNPLPAVHPDPTSLKEVPRDSLKTKFAAGLVDQAVKTLSEIWRPNITPNAFLPQTKLSVGPQFHGPISKQCQSLVTSPSRSNVSKSQTTDDVDSTLLPIRSFVHEVLRRSRTSATVLQTALCYLEGVRSKIPQIAKDETCGLRTWLEPECRIMPATEAELAVEAELALLEECSEPLASVDDAVKTVCVMDDASDDAFNEIEGNAHNSDKLADSFEPSPPVSTSSLPSPLLCPRRAFLAALILASKFSQDKCYSNRAWAKLSGLPSREIGRCERALGQALDWRLWVGKKTPSPASPSPIVRAQTESSIPSASAVRSTSANNATHPDVLARFQEGAEKAQEKKPVSDKALRRCSTLPATAFNPTSVHTSSSDDFSSMLTSTSNLDGSFISLEFTPPAFDPPSFVVGYSSKCAELSQEFTYSQESVSSSSPDTPTLTYSPSSTEMSLSSQPTQVVTVDDGMLVSYNPSQPWTSALDSQIFFKPASQSHEQSKIHIALGMSSVVEAVDVTVGQYSPDPWIGGRLRSELEPVGVY